MSLREMPKEEVELLSYTDLTYLLLKENKKSMNTAAIFKEICHLLEYSDEEYSAKIGDYYTSLTIDKRFVLLENHEWDLRERHSVSLEIDDEEEEVDELEEEDTDEDAEEAFDEEEEIDPLIDEEEIADLDGVDEDMEDLSIVSEEETEEN